MKKQSEAFGFIGIVTTMVLCVFGLTWAIKTTINYFNDNTVTTSEPQIVETKSTLTCSSGDTTFAGYGKMQIRDDKDRIDIFTWSFDKATTELYVAKSNARNFANDIDVQYKVVEVYYKDIE